MENWRLIISDPLPGPDNMAIDEAILMAVSQGLVPPTIRFYSWSPPTISLGYFQDLAKEVDSIACRKAGVDVVRRLTGGRAVLHQHELTYSLVAPENNAKVRGSVLESYLAISKGLVKGLSSLGVKVELAEGRKQSKLSSAACFDAPSWYEVVVNDRKLVGSAQTRKQGVLLQHGSILTDLDPELLFSILKFKDEKLRERAKGYFRAKATSLNEVLGYKPSFKELCDCLKIGFASEMMVNLIEQGLTENEVRWADELSEGKYSSDDWNARKKAGIV